MERMIFCFLAAIVIWCFVTVFASPIKLGFKLILNTMLGFATLWLFNRVGVHMGITLGLNPFNAAVLGLFGPSGMVMLLFLRWMGI